MITKEQRIENIEKELAQLKIELQEENKIQEETPEEFFNSIFNKDLTRKVDFEKYPNSQFYFDGEIILLEIEKSGETLYAWFNYPKIWNPISTEHNWDYDQTQAFLKVRIEEHFKLRDVTPLKTWDKWLRMIEEHFKLRDVTPNQLRQQDFSEIEEHFKLRDVTPKIKK